MICLVFFCITKEAAYVQNVWRELPETGVDSRHILGVLRLTLIPLRGTRVALRMTSPK
jgi:hypothetical protein